MRAVLLAMIAALAGCTATVSTYQLVSADDAVKRAAAAGAEQAAPYEFTMAALYLEKAREEAGYSDYRTARELASRAADLADQAVMKMQTTAERTSFDTLEDRPADAPAPAPAAPQLDWDKVVQQTLEEEERKKREEGVNVDELLDEEEPEPVETP